MDDHYFTADPSVPFRRVPVRVEVWGQELTLDTGSGVFAQGRLDVGTAVLFRETEPPRARSYLDLGCGYGVIGLALATCVPGATVRAVGGSVSRNSTAVPTSSRPTAKTPDPDVSARSCPHTAATTGTRLNATVGSAEK